jgi:hypothetical protein
MAFRFPKLVKDPMREKSYCILCVGLADERGISTIMRR